MSPRSAVAMNEDEIAAFLAESRTAVVATASPSGHPHLVAMWYLPVVRDLAVWTYGSSQKVANLRRDGRASVLIESGDTYETLRGVAIDVVVTIFDDPQQVAELGERLTRRYTGGPPYVPGDEITPAIRRQAAKRVGLTLQPVRYRTWDHAKLGARP